VTEGLPSYVSSELHESEKLVSYIPAPDLTARRRILLTSMRLLVVLAISFVAAFSEARSFFVVAGGLYLGVGLFIWTLNVCRTSYAITSWRVVRFVGEQKIEEAKLSEIAQPALLDYAAHDFFFMRWITRFLSLGPVVEIRRLKPEPWTVKAFLISRNLSLIRIGYCGHNLPSARILDDVTRAWEAAQGAPKAT
jgi:hypothetical protein